jgi:hypothetical protein
MGHANSVWPRNKTLEIAMSLQPGTAQTPATINETSRNVTAASWPFPPPRIGAFDAPATYNAASTASAIRVAKYWLKRTRSRDYMIRIRL